MDISSIVKKFQSSNVNQEGAEPQSMFRLPEEQVAARASIKRVMPLTVDKYKGEGLLKKGLQQLDEELQSGQISSRLHATIDGHASELKTLTQRLSDVANLAKGVHDGLFKLERRLPSMLISAIAEVGQPLREYVGDMIGQDSLLSKENAARIANTIKHDSYAMLPAAITEYRQLRSDIVERIKAGGWFVAGGTLLTVLTNSEAKLDAPDNRLAFLAGVTGAALFGRGVPTIIASLAIPSVEFLGRYLMMPRRIAVHNLQVTTSRDATGHSIIKITGEMAPRLFTPSGSAVVFRGLRIGGLVVPASSANLTGVASAYKATDTFSVTYTDSTNALGATAVTTLAELLFATDGGNTVQSVEESACASVQVAAAAGGN